MGTRSAALRLPLGTRSEMRARNEGAHLPELRFRTGLRKWGVLGGSQRTTRGGPTRRVGTLRHAHTCMQGGALANGTCGERRHQSCVCAEACAEACGGTCLP